MERKIEREFHLWKAEHSQKALVVSGARQVGKTHSIKEFAASNYRNHVYINFEDEPDRMDIFTEDTDADTLYDRLAFRYGIDFKDDCVLILDEIQLCPRAYSSLKPLAIDGRCDVIASGSLLGVMTYDDTLSPMGYTKDVVMQPMDFEEYLWAMGITKPQTASITRCIQNNIPLDDYIRRTVTDMFRRFIVVGGMPAAVKAYAETHDYSQVSAVHEEIYQKICKDATQYAPARADKLKIRECLDSVPKQLSNEKKVFNYSDILMKYGYGKREYGSALLWLKNAGIVDIVNNLEEPVEPLKIKADKKSFRVYMKDTGLLTFMLGPSIASGIVNGDFYVNNGAIMENTVAECLIRKGYVPYFYLKEKKKEPDGKVVHEGMELDFVINMNGSVTAIEVKSGSKTRSKSLTKAMGPAYRFDRGIKLADGGMMTDDIGVEHYPLFAVCFMEESKVPDLGPVDYIDDLKRALDSLRTDVSGPAPPSSS